MGCEVVDVREPRVASGATMDVFLEVLRVVCEQPSERGEAFPAPGTAEGLVLSVRPSMTLVRELRVEVQLAYVTAVCPGIHWVPEQVIFVDGDHHPTAVSPQEMREQLTL